MKPYYEEKYASGSQAPAKHWTVFLVGALLSFSAGTVNGAATVALVFERTMHMSGRGSDLLRDLIFNPPEGLLVFCLLGSFLLGAFLAGLLVPRHGATIVLLAGAALLAAAAGTVAATGASAGETAFDLNRYIVASLLALAGGLQNSATSLAGVGRTTHITGSLTDVGIAVATRNRSRAAFLSAKLVAFSAGGLAGFAGAHYGSLTGVLAICSLTVAAGALFWLKFKEHCPELQTSAAAARQLPESEN